MDNNKGMTIWKTIVKDMKRAGFTDDQIQGFEHDIHADDGFVLKNLKDDSRLKESLRTMLSKKPGNKLPADKVLDMKLAFCKGILRDRLWYGKDAIKLHASIGMAVYLTEQTLRELVGNHVVSRRMHAVFSKMPKRTKDVLKDLIVKCEYDKVAKHFPFEVQFLPRAPTYEEVSQMKDSKQKQATTLQTHGRSDVHVNDQPVEQVEEDASEEWGFGFTDTTTPPLGGEPGAGRTKKSVARKKQYSECNKNIHNKSHQTYRTTTERGRNGVQQPIIPPFVLEDDDAGTVNLFGEPLEPLDPLCMTPSPKPSESPQLSESPKAQNAAIDIPWISNNNGLDESSFDWML